MIRLRTISLLFLVVAVALGQSLDATENRPPRLTVASWNVLYGFNHRRAIDEGVRWVRGQRIDVLALQEMNGFTARSLADTARRYGHPHSVLQKEQGFAMALTANAPIEVLERRVKGFHHGYLHCRTHGMEFFVVHFWPGKEHEVRHVVSKAKARRDAGARVVILGDFNAHSERDAISLGTAVKPRHDALDIAFKAGFHDLVHRFDRRVTYSFPSPITIPRWSKDLDEVASKRQRIDFILADEGLADAARMATIVHEKEVEVVSDHYPVIAEFARAVGSRPVSSKRFSFGAIADCQYCGEPAAGRRRYSESPTKLRACVDHLNTLDLAFTVHLGDFIDRDFASFDVVQPIYESLERPAYHVLGNHDYSVADEHKASVPGRLGMKTKYYDFTVRGWRFIVLDGNDISFHAHPKGSVGFATAERFHREHASKAPKWNGAVGSRQLEWLRARLRRAEAAKESVVLFSHFPVYPPDVHNLWNAEQILATIADHPGVKAYINGHNHAGSYATKDGVHFLTLRGMVDTKHTSYAVVDVYDDRLSVRGFGREPDRTLEMR